MEPCSLVRILPRIWSCMRKAYPFRSCQTECDANSLKHLRFFTSARKPKSLSRGLTDRAVLRAGPLVQSASGLEFERVSISGTSEKEDLFCLLLCSGSKSPVQPYEGIAMQARHVWICCSSYEGSCRKPDSYSLALYCWWYRHCCCSNSASSSPRGARSKWDQRGLFRIAQRTLATHEQTDIARYPKAEKTGVGIHTV